MDLDALAVVHRDEWARLDQLSRRRRLTGPESDELVDLYADVATHLSLVRSQAPDAEVIAYLSSVLARARSRQTGTRPTSWRDAGDFFLRRFPAALYRTRWWWGVTALVNVAVAFAMGFRTGASFGAWLAAAGILLLFILALTWLAIIAGLSAKTVDGASAFSYPLIFLPFVSSAFVPTASMPAPVAWFAEHQPVTSIVDTLRSLFAGHPVGGDIWIALAWLVGILVVAYGAAVVVYRRRLR